MIAVVPPHRDFDTDVVFLALDKNRLRHDGGFVPVEVFDEFLHATLIKELSAQMLHWTLIGQNDAYTGIQERQLAQALFQCLK